MDDSINRAILFGDHPPNGMYFTVRVEYNATNPIFEGQMPMGSLLESDPIRSFPDAMEASDKITNSLLDKFGIGEVTQVDPMQHEGYHAYIHDPQHEMLARVGIETYDHRNETFH